MTEEPAGNCEHSWQTNLIVVSLRKPFLYVFFMCKSYSVKGDLVLLTQKDRSDWSLRNPGFWD